MELYLLCIRAQFKCVLTPANYICFFGSYSGHSELKGTCLDTMFLPVSAQMLFPSRKRGMALEWTEGLHLSEEITSSPSSGDYCFSWPLDYSQLLVLIQH